VSTKSTLGIGFIGCGRAGAELHLPAIHELTGVEVVALCDVDPDRLQTLAGRYGVERTYDHYRELLSDSNVGLVAVCVPVALRGEILFDALDSGKHVFVEKPLALSSRDARKALRASAAGKGKVFVGHNLRCHRLVEQCRDFIRTGVLGPIELVNSVWSTDLARTHGLPGWRQRLETGGGVLFEMGIHHFDLIEWLLSDRLKAVWCESHSRSSEISSAIVSGSSEKGTLVTCSFSQESVPRNYLEVCGTEGRIELDLYRFDGFRYLEGSLTGGCLESRLRSAVRLATELPTAFRLARQGGDYKLSYQRQWKRIIDAINGSATAPCTVEEAARAAEIAAAAVESAKLGSPVDLCSTEDFESSPQHPQEVEC
jgi:predicted dehydrogenase